MNNYTIYIHRNKINNKAYIGQTCQTPSKRWGKDGNRYSHSPHLAAAINKYGWNNFDHIIFATGLTLEQANEMETKLIALYDTTNPSFGYNINLGGNNHCQSTESRRKNSESQKGKVLSEETKRKISKAMSKPIYCVELNKTFESGVAAAQALGINSQGISKACRGQLKTYKGYHWRYADEHNF